MNHHSCLVLFVIVFFGIYNLCNIQCVERMICLFNRFLVHDLLIVFGLSTLFIYLRLLLLLYYETLATYAYFEDVYCIAINGYFAPSKDTHALSALFECSSLGFNGFSSIRLLNIFIRTT